MADTKVRGPLTEENGRVAAAHAYVASQRLESMTDEAVLELRGTDQGQLAVLAYSSLEVLVDGCGSQQAWLCVPTDSLGELVSRSGADGVLWDADLPEEQRHEPFDDVPMSPFGDDVISEKGVERA